MQRFPWDSPAFGLLGIGMFLAIMIVGATWLGVYLDRRFDTEPLLTLVFLLLGILAGGYEAFRRLKEVTARSAARYEREDRERRTRRRGPNGRGDE